MADQPQEATEPLDVHVSVAEDLHMNIVKKIFDICAALKLQAEATREEADRLRTMGMDPPAHRLSGIASHIETLAETLHRETCEEVEREAKEIWTAENATFRALIKGDKPL